MKNCLIIKIEKLSYEMNVKKGMNEKQRKKNIVNLPQKCYPVLSRPPRRLDRFLAL